MTTCKLGICDGSGQVHGALGVGIMWPCECAQSSAQASTFQMALAAVPWTSEHPFPGIGKPYGTIRAEDHRDEYHVVYTAHDEKSRSFSFRIPASWQTNTASFVLRSLRFAAMYRGPCGGSDCDLAKAFAAVAYNALCEFWAFAEVCETGEVK